MNKHGGLFGFVLGFGLVLGGAFILDISERYNHLAVAMICIGVAVVFGFALANPDNS